MGRFSREELQQAHDRMIEVANISAASGDWGPWSEMFTEDATYDEHHYGVMTGRAEILAWITETMSTWPNSEMKAFPHEWCVCDEERDRWICQIQNRFVDPGDGGVYEAPNITILQYAGDMQFSSEEDVYNPARFAPVVRAWIDASRRAAEGA